MSGRMAAIPPTSNPSATTTYTFASQPRAVSGSRKKFRDPAAAATASSSSATHMQKTTKRPVGHMMFDPRIVRGNTHRQQTLPASQQPDPLEIQRKQELARRRRARKKAQQKARPRTPEAVDGRKHMDVQTELYLEELTDRVEETDMQTQTDPFMDRPPSPLFIPPKTGVDVATQILEGELFDFDVEAKPILEVLVGKTMEQAMMEVMEEEELDQLRDHQRQFEDLRAAELAEMQRLEEAARRREAEKDARIAEQREALQQQKETAEKIAARAFAQSYLSTLVPSVFTSLNDHGFFYDQQEREVETQVIPWLMDSVEERLGASATAERLLDHVLRQVVAKRSAERAPPSVEITAGEEDNRGEGAADKADEGPEGKEQKQEDDDGDGDAAAEAAEQSGAGDGGDDDDDDDDKKEGGDDGDDKKEDSTDADEAEKPEAGADGESESGAVEETADKEGDDATKPDGEDEAPKQQQEEEGAEQETRAEAQEHGEEAASTAQAQEDAEDEAEA